MAVHQFGIMDRPPQTGEVFDRYEPEKYRCIAVGEEAYDQLSRRIGRRLTFWNGLRLAGCGLNDAGITLIAPGTAGDLAEKIRGDSALSPLRTLLFYAYCMQKWVIHFGI